MSSPTESLPLARTLLSREEWCGRHNNFVTKYLYADTGQIKGIIGTDGRVWQQTR